MNTSFARPAILAGVFCLSLFSSRAFAQTAFIKLQWTPNREADLCCYIICRDTSPGTLQAHDWVSKSDSTYEDDQVSYGQTYYYKLMAVDDAGNYSAPSGEVMAVAHRLKVENFALGMNYPNPFQFSTAITYYLPRESRISLRIFNQLGQTVKILVEETQSRGHHKIYWDGRDDFGNKVVAGIYYYQMIAEGFQKTGKSLLWR